MVNGRNNRSLLKQIRVQAYLFLIAVPLHLIWEVAQITAYDFPGTSLTTDVIGCFLPSLGDGLMTLMIYWSGWFLFREPEWILKPGAKGYLLILGVGLTLALLVEWNALYRTGAWAYSERMITIPLVGVGLLPILQMAVLPIVTVLLVQWLWKKSKAEVSQVCSV